MIIRPKKLAPAGKEMPVGPHAGKLIETVILKYPDFIFWLAEQDPNPAFDWLYEYIQKRVDAFDAKPYPHVTCAGHVEGQPCTSPVTRFSLYDGQSIPYFWCEKCDPLHAGATANKVTTHNDYYSALNALDRAGATREQKRNLIHLLLEAKGLTGNLTDSKVLSFFCPPSKT